MEQYSDDLVELGNQAWILNGSLAELHRFKGAVERHIAAQPSTTETLGHDLAQDLIPAIERLKVRQQALLAKWLRRIREQSLHPQWIVVLDQPWGSRLVVPEPLSKRMQVEDAVSMTLADARELACRYPDQFFTAYKHRRAGDDTDVTQAPDAIVDITRFAGVHLSVSKMWWSWWLEPQWPLCRLQVMSENLWEIDSCGS
ncbi:hypothetical protein [Aestuariirhabdus sp. LZHN29]|uniref:hypothetical protein n=1 Tax=Aestuariirhabdus sp. LZHN29 TaxID=3417462 RepID=UPI003CF4B12E